MEPCPVWQLFLRACSLGLALAPVSGLHALASTDEARTVTTLATAPLGVLFNDNTYTPVASFRGSTYFVWVNSDNRPKVGVLRNGAFSSAYLSPNAAYTIRADGHHFFSLGIDNDGYLHVTGDMHNYPAADMTLYPTEYKGKTIMYWVSKAPESVAGFDFVGGDPARAIPGYGFSYHSFQYDQDRRLYFLSRVKVHAGGHYSGEMGLGLFRYDAATRRWTALGGLAPSSPAATYKSILWEDNGHNLDGTGGIRNFYQGYRASCRFDLDNRLHVGSTICDDNRYDYPTHAVYGRSDDGGLTFKRADGTSIAGLPMRAAAVAAQGDVVEANSKLDLYASVAFDRAGEPLVGYSTNIDRLRFSYRHHGSGAWSALLADPFGTYIRAKYHLDANGVFSFMSPSGSYRRQNSLASAGYNASVGANGSFVCVDELGLRENNEFIGLSSASGQVSLVKLSFVPVLAGLPASWTAASLGTVASPVAGQFNGVYTLSGASAGLGGAADSARVAWQAVSGDVDLKARVISLGWSADAAQAGIFLRQGSGSDAPMAAAAITYKQGAKLITRASAGAAAAVAVKAGHTASEWLRLVRTGASVSAYRSDNGQAWQLIGTQALALSTDLQAGFFQASGDAAKVGTARFDNLSLQASHASTPTRTPTLTRSPTPTRSSTPSATRSATPSLTRSATPSLTRSATPSVTRSTTRTATSTATPSASPSATASATPSGTPSATPSPTRSATPSLTYSATPSSTHSVTPSSTVSGTPSLSPSGTPSLTPSDTPSATATPTLGSTYIPTRTPSPSVTPSATSSLTGTATASATPGFSPSFSPTPTAVATFTPSPTATMALAASGPDDGGALRLLRAVAAPNPVAGARLRLSLQTEGPADQVLVRIYSPALVCVRQAEAPGAAKGWSQLTVGLDGLSPGLYHCQVRLKRGQALSSPALVAFYFEGRP